MSQSQKTPFAAVIAALAAALVFYGCSKEEGAPAPAAPTEETAPADTAAPADTDAASPADTAAMPEETPPADAAAPAAEPAPAPAEAAAPVAMGDATAGKKTYDAVCASCHATGVAGAPKTGDKAAWAPRIATGMDAMMATVLNGKGAMPPRGACPNCSDDDLKNSVAYMVEASK